MGVYVTSSPLLLDTPPFDGAPTNEGQMPNSAASRLVLAPFSEQAVIDAINARKTPTLADARERMCFLVASELPANKGLSKETYFEAEKIMGVEGLVALVASIGSFSMTCLTANSFEIDPPAANPTPLRE